MLDHFQKITPESIAGNAIFQGELKKINTNLPAGLVQINDFTGFILKNHPDLQPLRNYLGESVKSQNKVLNAIIHHSFPTPDQLQVFHYQELLSATSQKEELSRGIILRLLDEGKTFGLKPFEINVLKASCEVGNLYDRMCFKWRQDVQESEVNAKAKELSLVNPYSVVVSNNTDGFMEIPYAEYFKEETDQISQHWSKLAESLGETEDLEAQSLKAYFEEYILALRETDLTQVEERWRNVDRAWLKIKGRFLPISFREEGYYDPNAIRNFPDFRLALKRDELRQYAEPTREAMMDLLGKRFGDKRVFQATKNGLETVQIVPISDIVYAGDLDFQPAGQSLPNDETVKSELGTINMLNLDVIKARWDEALQLAEEVFPQDIDLFKAVDPLRDGFAIAVAGHEFGEPLFQTEELEKSFGEDRVALMNEDLANLSITGIIREWANRSENSLDKQAVLNHLILNLGFYLRYLDIARGQEILRAYYKMGLLGLNRYLDTNFIYREQEKWRIDPKMLDMVYRFSETDLGEQVAIAEDKIKEHADSYLSRGNETENILDLVRIINQE